jgi:predicted Rossmann-fold nucleotide-binding protein
VFLYGSSYWREVVNFEALARHGTISPADLTLFEFVDEPHAALELLKGRIALEPATPVPKPAFARSRCPAR